VSSLPTGQYRPTDGAATAGAPRPRLRVTTRRGLLDTPRAIGATFTAAAWDHPASDVLRGLFCRRARSVRGVASGRRGSNRYPRERTVLCAVIRLLPERRLVGNTYTAFRYIEYDPQKMRAIVSIHTGLTLISLHRVSRSVEPRLNLSASLISPIVKSSRLPATEWIRFSTDTTRIWSSRTEGSFSNTQLRTFINSLQNG